MDDKIGYSALEKFILITALAKGLLIDRSVMALGGGGFLVPLLAAVPGVTLVLLLSGKRISIGSAPASVPKKIGMALLALSIFCETGATVCRMGMNMKFETFLTTGETTVAAIALSAMVITAFFGITGMDGAGKIGLILTIIVMALILWANYANYDIFRILPPVGTDARGYGQAVLRWMMGFWPVALLWIFPQRNTRDGRIRTYGIRAVICGALWSGGILFACILVRSPYSVQTGFSPVEFLFEQATMGRTFYRLDPLLSIVITATAVVAGALGLYTCAALFSRVMNIPDVRPMVVLVGMALLCAVQWVLSPSSPLWGAAAYGEEVSPYLFLCGLAFMGISVRRTAHD